MSCNDIITPSREDLRYLVDLIHVRKRKRNHQYCVMYAVMNEDEYSLSNLIKLQAPLNTLIDVEDQDVKGGLDSKTALHWAARNGSTRLMRMLLEAGADSNMKGTHSGRTPLHECCSVECGRMLIAAGGCVNIRDNTANSSSIALHYATSRSEVNYEYIKLLVSSGSDVMATNLKGQTPLHNICTMNTQPFERMRVVNLLLSAGSSVNPVDHHGHTPLHCGAGAGAERCCAALIRAGALVNATDYEGRTPLHMAAKWRGNVTVLRTLLMSGCDPSYATHADLHTPLHVATIHDCEPCIHILLHYGAYLYSKDRNGNTVFDYYSSKQYKVRNEVMRTVHGTPPSLASLCRTTIRRQLGPENLHKLFSLPLPRQILLYINYEMTNIISYQPQTPMD